MLVLTMALLLMYAFFLPVTIQADVYHYAATQARIAARFVCLWKTWHISGLSGAAAQFRQRRIHILLDTLRRADKARYFLLHHIHLDRLDAFVLLRTQDAARSAILSGTLLGFLAFIPAIRRKGVRIRVLPEFFRAHSTLSARCIIRIRLGTIILTALMLLMAYFRGQHLAESEAV